MRRKKASIKFTNKKRRICQIIIIFGRFLFSTDGTWRKERSGGGWKVRTRHQGPEGSHCHEKLDSRMSMGWASLARACGVWRVYSGWREMMTGELERCGDSSEWVNNPVQPRRSGPRNPRLRAGPRHSQPRVFIEAGPGLIRQRRRLPPIKGLWWLLIPD